MLQISIVKPLFIIGDADGLIAFINPEDANNEKANQTILFLQRNNALLYFPTSTIAEVITTLQRKHASPVLAQKVIDQCKAEKLFLIPVENTLITIAIGLFKPYGSKKNTFFDAIVAATARQQNADAIFSFDGWYRNLGFKLASDLFFNSFPFKKK